MRFFSIIAFFLSMVLIGCGSEGVVPVSGKVTVDGKPHKGLIVSFQPLGGKKNINPGRGSSGITDENGNFTLLYDGTSPGALVGKHRVRIFTQMGVEPPPADDKSESDSKTVLSMKTRETIPLEWHEKSEKEFEVPSGGSKDANFHIERGKKK